MSDNCKMVSVIIPVLNEEKYISELIRSLAGQDYPHELIEWLFVDGGSCDDTIRLIKEDLNKYGLIGCVLNNENKTAPYAFNIGVENSKGDIIIRMDAHAEFPENYISRCVYYLETTDAWNVGGYCITKGRGSVGECIAQVQSSKFGVGNSTFRVSQETAYVDTVPFGAFHRELFDKIGLFDTSLPRSEDNEFNYRIRKNGGKVLMAGDIYCTYYCRDKVSSFAQMSFANGNAVGYTKLCHPGVMGIKYLIPFAFDLSIIGALLSLFSKKFKIFRSLFALEFIVYFFLDIAESFRNKLRLPQKVLTTLLFPIFHISYGAGTFKGLVKGLKTKIKK